MNRTILHDKHVAAGARMIDFGGWEMPVVYTDIQTEHEAVRKRAGLFDLCHMGRISVTGRDAEALVQKAQTNDMAQIGPGRIRYAMLLNEHGGVIDDILVHRRSKDIFLVVNASNYVRDARHLGELSRGMHATVTPLDNLGMIAIQGPASAGIVKKLTDDIDVDALGYYRLAEGHVGGEAATLTRTGYTGEDGFEIYVDEQALPVLWDKALAAGHGDGLVPCGLGARDTLRLEAGMPLYGHEMDESVNPVEAGLMFGVRLKGHDFIGKPAIERVKAEGAARTLIGLVVDGKRIPRQGYAVMRGDDEVGRVASGTWSPTFQQACATALVKTEAIDADLEIDVRGRRVPARRVELPFYKRDGTGSLQES